MASLPLSSTRTRCAPVNTHRASQNSSEALFWRAHSPHPQPSSSIGSGLPSLSKRWLSGLAARIHKSLASCGGLRSSIRCARSGRFPGGTQRGLRLLGGLVGVSTIAAAGRSGVEEVYGVPYLGVGCDVCFDVARFTTSPH